VIEIQPAEENQETLRELRALSEGLQEKAIRAALHKAAKPVVDAMRIHAPDDRRTAGSRLARAINKTQARTGNKVATGAGRRYIKLEQGEVGLIIGPNKKVEGRSVKGIALATEFGARPHKISARNNKFLRIGRKIIRGSIQHPGIKARHWMGQALESSGAAFDQLFYNGLEAWIEKNGR
jgi:hypothetical protein